MKKITITPFAEQRRYRVHGRPGSVSVIHILLLVSVVSITAHIAFLCHVQWGGSENAFFGLLTTALRIFLLLKVMRFAEETKSHIKDWSVDLGHGSRAGTKVVFIVKFIKFIIITITVIMNITRMLH